MAQQKKVLVCDDDQSILEVIKIILEENNYKVMVSNTGKGIQKKIKQFKPHIVLLDIWMPGMDGKEATKVLKKDPATKNTPIIVVSALNESEKISREIGADGFLPKPFNILDLLSIVRKHTGEEAKA